MYPLIPKLNSRGKRWQEPLSSLSSIFRPLCRSDCLYSTQHILDVAQLLNYFFLKSRRNSKEFPKPLKCFLWHQKTSTKLCTSIVEKWVREKRVAILTIWEVRMMTAVRERWKSRKAWEAVGRGGGKERVVQVQDARWPELAPDRFPPHKGSCPIWVTSACTIPPHHLLPDLPSTPILADRGALYNVGC